MFLFFFSFSFFCVNFNIQTKTFPLSPSIKFTSCEALNSSSSAHLIINFTFMYGAWINSRFHCSYYELSIFIKIIKITFPRGLRDSVAHVNQLPLSNRHRLPAQAVFWRYFLSTQLSSYNTASFELETASKEHLKFIKLLSLQSDMKSYIQETKTEKCELKIPWI